MALLYGRAGRLTAEHGGLRPGQMPIERLPYRITKFSHTESRMLIKRYNFHNGPGPPGAVKRPSRFP